MRRCERRCEDEKVWKWEGVKRSRCEEEQMWRWEGVKMRRCEDEKMWRWADVKMRRCERRCEDEKVWRWEGVKMRRCEGEKVWRWEDEIQTPTIGRTLRSDALGNKSEIDWLSHHVRFSPLTNDEMPIWIANIGQGLSPQDAQGGPSVAGGARRGAAAVPGTEGQRGTAGARGGGGIMAVVTCSHQVT